MVTKKTKCVKGLYNLFQRKLKYDRHSTPKPVKRKSVAVSYTCCNSCMSYRKYMQIVRVRL